MHRFVPLAAVLATIATCLPASAATPAVSGKVDGTVLALAFSGDSTVVARRPAGRAIRIELRRPGQDSRLLLAPRVDTGATVRLAASPQAIVVAFGSDDEDAGPSQVWAGAPGGPLREVAGCTRSFVTPTVTVDGARVGWADGGCAGPGDRPSEVGPASVAVADADPQLPVTRVPVPQDSLPVGIALRGTGGLVAVLRPTFFGGTTDLRSLSPEGLGVAREREVNGVLLPVGFFADGTAGLVHQADSEDGFTQEGEQPRCPADVVVLAPGATTRQELPGGCLVDDEPLASTDATVAGERLVSRSTPLDTAHAAYDAGPSRVALTSVRADGSDLRTIVSGTYRSPQGLAADGTRVGWWQRRCAGGTTLAAARAPVGALRACTLRVLRRHVAVQAGRIALPVSCPLGCTGLVVDVSRCGRQARRRFALPPGVRRLHVPLTRGGPRRRAVLHVDIDGGRSRNIEVRLRR